MGKIIFTPFLPFLGENTLFFIVPGAGYCMLVGCFNKPYHFCPGNCQFRLNKGTTFFIEIAANE
jgi:hypothetical protein